MDINDLIWICFHDHRRDCYEESCQNDKLYATLFQLFQKCFVKFFSAFILFWRNTYSFYVVILCSLQRISLRIIADNQRNFCICNLSTVNGIRIACRFVPPPETSTPTFNIKSLPFHHLRYVLLRTECHLLL